MLLGQALTDLQLETLAATGTLVTLVAVAVYRLLSDDRRGSRHDRNQVAALERAIAERDASRSELAEVRTERDLLYRIAVQHGWDGRMGWTGEL